MEISFSKNKNDIFYADASVRSTINTHTSSDRLEKAIVCDFFNILKSKTFHKIVPQNSNALYIPFPRINWQRNSFFQLLAC